MQLIGKEGIQIINKKISFYNPYGPNFQVFLWNPAKSSVW